MKKLLFVIIFFTALSNYSIAQDTNTTSSGLKYILIEKGNGPKAENGKQVEVHYTGYLPDGKKFDSSRDRNAPIAFVLGEGKVIKGWDEGIALMNVDDKLQLIIPPELGYGKRGAGDVIPPDATLIFDVELISVEDSKTSIGEVLLGTILEKDIQSAVDQYKKLRNSSPDGYDFKENELNNLGYQLLQMSKTKEAIEILKLNVHEYPNSSNVYDSLGEAYMADGNNKLAIENYKKSLKLDPKNDNAKKMIEKLQK